jgi:hypothetical protein
MKERSCYICLEKIQVETKWYDTDEVLYLCENCQTETEEFKNQLTDFNERTSTKTWNIRDFNEKRVWRNIVEVKRKLVKDEIVLDYLINIIFSSVSAETWGMIVLTNKRLLIFIPGPRNNTYMSEEISLNIEEIIDLTLTKELVSHSLDIKVQGGFKSSKLKIRDKDDNVLKFKKSFSEIKAKLSSQIVNNNEIKNNNDDTIEKIKKLKELVDLNILTQEEFELKKKQLLENL